MFVAIMRDGHPQLPTMENNSALLLHAVRTDARSGEPSGCIAIMMCRQRTKKPVACCAAIRYNREEDIEVGAQSVQFLSGVAGALY